MKKIYTFLIVLSTGSLLNSQTLTQSNNAFVVGDTFSTLRCDSVNIVPGIGGTNVTWNFSALAIYSTAVNNFTVGSSSSNLYPSGSVVVASATNNELYLKSSATDLQYYGGNLQIGTVAATLIYSTGAIDAIYPMTINSTSTSAIAGTINVSSLAGTFTGNSVVTADGSGTLVLPGGAAGTYTNVLRVVSSQTLNYTASLVSGKVIQTQYDYYTPSAKAPLLTIATTSFTSSFSPGSTTTGTTTTIDKSYLGTMTGIAVHQGQLNDLLVYPNPANSVVNFSTENKTVKEIRVYDITGKLVEKQNFGEGNLKLDVSDYNKGLYIYSLLNTGGETLKTGKLTIN